MTDVRHRNRSDRRAFTVVELLIVIAIVAVIMLISLPYLFGRRNTGDLKNTAAQIATLLRQAQSASMAQKQGMSWGVHFQNSTTTMPFYALFSSAYGASSTVGYYPLPGTVAYDTSTLAAGSSLDVIFSQVSGLASASTSIGLYLTSDPSIRSVISVASSGAVSF